MGTILVLITIPLLFMPPIGLRMQCYNSNTSALEMVTGAVNFRLLPRQLYSELEVKPTPLMECDDKDETLILVYYLIFAMLFNLAWATIQISHLAMIPEITSVEKNRMELSSVRNAATVVSNLSSYAIFLLLIKTSNVKTKI